MKANNEAGRCLHRITGVLVGVMTLSWPFLVWFSITHPDHRWLLPLLALVFLARLLMLRGDRGLFRETGLLLAAVGAALCVASLWLRDRQWLMWYPVAVNAVMLTLFFGSLFSRMPFIERIARLREPDLPARAIVYTRRVTQVWCLFFVCNGAIALLTCLSGNMVWWTAWNGMFSYLLMGLLMGGEWLIRQRLRTSA
ncbi:hypothetical protein DZA65_04369 [Dickeya dianthicola]|uniref:DNA gyrase subunit B n=1 Tax=Dickeya dianthicola TaxID=204039 RepID=A0AAP2GBB2_9GAMM|nr:hypothetical protein [Dickeya dianthicola]ATO35424.1 hypothetical protein DDI_4256 [Dickeya dianthicola RNS04.9]AYC21196.1 hypothetical protein DZA65_04369 [Dickeya dianthicola]MBI0437979.1 DNA gyrase subunit B [Dickeya dianthicola]MBI0448182.1 DNA gyrase subunit B [Dickeya dianthicola]MBI0452796.1 DNA gyrase subunit B [Dickeya dianthicola]